jgi:hypothetical protein
LLTALQANGSQTTQGSQSSSLNAGAIIAQTLSNAGISLTNS